MIFLKRVNSGFTLLELLLVLAITAILAVIAFPLMDRFIATQRVKNRADQLQALIQFARSDAVRTNQPVLICPIKNSKDTTAEYSCVQFKDYNDGLGWQGFLAFHDVDLDGKYTAKKDSILKIVAQNQSPDNSDKAKIKVKIKYGVFCAENKHDNVFGCKGRIDEDEKLGFMPNGQFKIGDGDGRDVNGMGISSWPAADSYLVFLLYDSKNTNITQRLIISPGGNVESCSKNNSTLCEKNLDTIDD